MFVALGLPGAQASAGPAHHRPDWIGQTGVASYYGAGLQGRRTASGAPFNKHALTAAHPWLPFGTKVRVTAERTGRSVVVTITDRLPFGKRIIDLSRHAAQVLGIVHQGLAVVSLSPTS